MAIKKREALIQSESPQPSKSGGSPSAAQTGGGAINDIQKHVMTGISSMIPFLIMGGLILAFSQLLLYVFLKLSPSTGVMDAINSGQYSGVTLMLLRAGYLTESFGGTLFGFAIPIFAAFTANSIAGKLAFPAGFIGGLIAIRPSPVLNLLDGKWSAASPVASGFIGALIIAFAAGHFVKWLNQNIKMGQNWLAFKTTFLIPIIAALFVMLGMRYVVTPIGGYINQIMSSVLTSAGRSGEILYAAALSLATAIDLGGPINKAAGFVALPFTTDRLLPITARCIAIVVPPIGLGLATLIDKMIVGRRVFDKQFYPQGKTAIFLAFMGISEGAIPFALERPKIAIPAYMIGSLTGALTAVLLGAKQWFPESAVWVWPLIENFPAYFGGIALGALVTALYVIILRNGGIKKGALSVDSND